MTTPDKAYTRALVLGGTGMIGAHAVRACLQRKIRVRALIRVLMAFGLSWGPEGPGSTGRRR